MKRVVLFFLLGIFICPAVAIAQEDGWKDLKWGMNLKEIKQVYINEKTGKKCRDIRSDNMLFTKLMYGIIERYDKSYDTFIIDREFSKYNNNNTTPITYVTCDNNGTDLVLFDGKFFGRVKEFDSFSGINFEDKKTQDEIMNQLKANYPKGKISYKKDTYLAGGTSKRTVTYPVFGYTSNNILVFNTLHTLYFLDVKAVNELVNIYLKAKQQEEQQKQKKTKIF